MNEHYEKLSRDFAEAWNALGLAIVCVLCLAISALIAFTGTIMWLLVKSRAWIAAGAHVPDWIVPNFRFNRTKEGKQVQ